MALTEKRLGAARPADTNNATLYTVPASTTVIITSIIVCNTTASDATCRVFLTPSGGTADQTTAIVYDYTIPANDSKEVLAGRQILEASGTIVVRTGTASALTFTGSGGQQA